jgi:hypothetical protein
MLVAVTAASLWAAAPGYAAGETFKALSVTAHGCNSGDFVMTVERANLDGGASYTVHTVAAAGGLVYMNEAASISVNGESNWSLFNNFTYAPVSNPGTWPIPNDKRLRVDFTLERPKGGPVLYRWTLVVDGCNTGNVLYNAKTSDDFDRDLVPVPKDKCPKLAAKKPNGCPLRTRKLSIAYAGGAGEFFGRLSAKRHPKLARRRTVTIWRVRPGPDKRIGKAKTTKRGRYRLAFDASEGVFYAVSKAIVVRTEGQAARTVSRKLRLH